MNKTDLIYEYLTTKCVGKENRLKSNFFMDKFDIHNNKTFRSHIEKMREGMHDKYPIRIESISGRNGGYYVRRPNESVNTVAKFKQRTRRTAQRARELEKAPALGQFKMKFKKIFRKGN
ncbi:MAG: hypothetical protein HFH45_03455 [Bacilli bacterium]|nr:hypothetical protein [Bacilli bacterium]